MDTNKAITQAFKAMRADGIIARQNFKCCMSCGCAAIDADHKEKKRLTKKDGYCFYHRQDVDRVDHTGVLMLAYGSFNEGKNDEATEAVGARVVKHLRAAGFEVEWTGAARERISVIINPERRKKCAN